MRAGIIDDTAGMGTYFRTVYDLQAQGFGLTEVASRVAEVLGIEKQKVWLPEGTGKLFGCAAFCAIGQSESWGQH